MATDIIQESLLDPIPLPSTEAPAVGGGGGGNVIEFFCQSQQQSNWCWSASTVSVAEHYKAGTGWSQCLLAGREFGLGDDRCCTNGSSAECNRPWFPDRALSRTGNNDGYRNGPHSWGDIQKRIGYLRPISAIVTWRGGGGHSMIVSWWSAPNHIRIEDPIYGRVVLTYEEFRDNYQGAGNWVAGVDTRPY